MFELHVVIGIDKSTDKLSIINGWLSVITIHLQILLHFACIKKNV